MNAINWTEQPKAMLKHLATEEAIKTATETTTVGASTIIREGDFTVRILRDGETFRYVLPDNRELDRIIAVLEKPDWDELELRAAVQATEEATE